MKVRGVSTRASAHSAEVTTLVVAFAVLGAVGAPGCSTNSVDPGDAGAPAQDIGPYVVDIRPVPYPTYCGDDGPCPAGTECREEGFCSYSWYDVCAFDDAGRAVQVTLNGDPCAITDVSPSGSARGIGMPAAFCTALANPQSYEALHYGEVFPTGCRWSDGSVLATPSEDACHGIPFSPGPLVDAPWSFCGGPCGNVDCGETGDANALLDVLGSGAGDYAHVCAGANDERAFGACTVTARQCSREHLSDVAGCVHWLTESWGGEQFCACMFTDQDGSEPEAQGWVVPRSVCRRYRELYPDSVNCRDDEFALMP